MSGSNARGWRISRGGEPQHNAGLMREVLAGVGGPLRDIVLLNSGAALVIAGRAESLADGIELAARSLDFGRGAAGAGSADHADQRSGSGGGGWRMTDVLAEICAEKRAHVARCKGALSEAALLAGLAEAPPVRPFAAALERHLAEGRYGLIAEIKKASPSAGLIRERFDPPELARAYEAGGASCLSVLTDTPYFQGSDADLGAARQAGGLPVLRKDFILDPYQIIESRRIGADCVLLIMAALSDAMANELAAAAADLGLDVLVEVHDRAELDRALQLPVRMIGINNRDLKTLRTDLHTTEVLAPEVPSDRLVVAESGIRTPADLDRLAAAGARSFLVGETLMRQADVTEATRRLLRLSRERGFTHLDAEGRARMVDISDKQETDRVAVAGARVVMRPETLERIRAGMLPRGMCSRSPGSPGSWRQSAPPS